MRRLAEPSNELLVRPFDGDLPTPPVIDQGANGLDVVMDVGEIARSHEHGSV